MHLRNASLWSFVAGICLHTCLAGAQQPAATPPAGSGSPAGGAPSPGTPAAGSGAAPGGVTAPGTATTPTPGGGVSPAVPPIISPGQAGFGPPQAGQGGYLPTPLPPWLIARIQQQQQAAGMPQQQQIGAGVNGQNDAAMQLRRRNNKGATINSPDQAGTRPFTNPTATAPATDPSDATDSANSAGQSGSTDAVRPESVGEPERPSEYRGDGGQPDMPDGSGGNQMFLSWLNSGYRSQIQLATLAKDRATSPLVRDFAAQSLQSGTRFSQRLQQLGVGTAAAGASIDANGNGLAAQAVRQPKAIAAIRHCGQIRKTRSPAAPPLEIETPSNGARRRRAPMPRNPSPARCPTPPRIQPRQLLPPRTRHTAGATGTDDIMSGMDLVSDLQNLDGNFDRVYLNVQLASLVNRLNSLAAMSQNVPQNMQDLISQDFAATRQQILRARNILSQLDSNASGAASASQAPRLRSRSPNTK